MAHFNATIAPSTLKGKELSLPEKIRDTRGMRNEYELKCQFETSLRTSRPLIFLLLKVCEEVRIFLFWRKLEKSKNLAESQYKILKRTSKPFEFVSWEWELLRKPQGLFFFANMKMSTAYSCATILVAVICAQTSQGIPIDVSYSRIFKVTLEIWKWPKFQFITFYFN